MGPRNHPTSYPERHTGRRRKHAVRRRRCLLKGCEQRFHSQHAGARYCSSRCRAQARKWVEWKARRAYRTSAKGKAKRQRQSRRYRKRLKTRPASKKDPILRSARVIPKFFFPDSCDRPGCYECFRRPARSPRQRFCSRACRRALERVWERERRWRARHRKMRSPTPLSSPRHRRDGHVCSR